MYKYKHESSEGLSSTTDPKNLGDISPKLMLAQAHKETNGVATEVHCTHTGIHVHTQLTYTTVVLVVVESMYSICTLHIHCNHVHVHIHIQLGYKTFYSSSSVMRCLSNKAKCF